MVTVTVLLATVLAGEPDIDSILSDAWQERKLQPAAICSDDEFVRRVTLDLVGRIPTVEELESFRNDPDRGAKIDALLGSEEFPGFWSAVWTNSLHGYRSEFGSDREVMRLWLRDAIAKDRPYDAMVTEMLTTQEGSAFSGAANFLVRHPQDPVVKVSRLFLGVRLDCARCHDHPFDRWTQDDFRQMSRFFDATTRNRVSNNNVRVVDRRIEAANDDDRPRFLTGSRPRTTRWRHELALFVTHSKPFARTFANRVWYQLMGRGIVHPPDDFNRDNPPVIPELLEHLRLEVTRMNFQFRPLIRKICNSEAYQRSSVNRDRDDQAIALFACRTIKPLTAEQTIDSAVIALNVELSATQRQRAIADIAGTSLDDDLSETWLYRETVQGLMTRLSQNTPKKIASTPETYLRILSRVPTERELAICRGKRPEDIAFALVNSNEFYFNH